MSEQFSKITLNQIDIDAVADYVVQSKKLVYRQGDLEVSDTNAMDVDKVSGVESDTIAIAIDKDNRDTVNNALNLGGIPASDYMTATTGAGMVTNQLNMKQQYGSDIQDIRDELYQLRNELVKSGVVENNGQYAGYIDTFKRNHYINLQNSLGVANTSNTTANNQLEIEDVDVYNAIDVLDFISIYNTENAAFDVKQVAAKDDASRIITLDSDLRSIVRANGLQLYKSQGIIHDGLYKFASEAGNLISTEEFHTGLSDDTYNLTRRLNTRNTGFGTSFRVPEAKQGFVTSFEICAKAYGAPGALMCYLIDSRDVDKFLNPSQAESEYQEDMKNERDDGWHFFAASQPYTLQSSMGKRYISFNFLQSDGSYPLMTRDADGNVVRYVAIIEALDVDTSNYYDILFLQHRSTGGTLGDLELNNITYNYTRRSNDSVQGALYTDDSINEYDMYYHIVTRGVSENEPEAQKQGLYSAHYSLVNQKYDMTAAKARLMLRVKREGEWATVTDSTEPQVFNGNVINVVNTSAVNNIKNTEDLRLKTEIYKRIEERISEADISESVNVVIGSNVTKVQGVDTASVTAQKPILVSNNDKVYRCGYLVNLKAREIKFDSNTGEYSVGAWDHYVLPLTGVYKDYEPVKDEYSDRLIFENSLVGKDLTVKNYNDFELQIFWENRELSTYPDIKSSQMGAIKDLVLSFAKGF